MDLVGVTDLVPAPGVAWRPGDAFLAGGSWLFSEPQPALTRLLDLQAFGWPSLVERDGGLEIAATCTLAELAAFPVPLFDRCVAALRASFKVCAVATVGGNICLALPAGSMTTLTVALDGVAELWGADGERRHLPVADLVLGPRRTALRPGELLRSVFLPGPALRARHAVRQASLTHHGRSATLIVGRRDADGTTVLTVTAATPRPVQLRFPAPPDPSSAVAAVEEAVSGDWYDDLHGAPDWRAAMTGRLVAEVADELAAA